MTNEEMERVMNFIIERQEVFVSDIQQMRNLFAEQMGQSNERMGRVEAMVEHSALQQAHINEVLVAVIETQDRTSQEVRTLTTQVDRIAEAVAVLLDRDNKTNGDGRNKLDR